MEKQFYRPLVGDDVMQIDDQDMLLGFELQQGCAQQQVRTEVKGSIDSVVDQSFDLVFSFRLGDANHFEFANLDADLFVDDLLGSFLYANEPCPQCLVTAEY